MCGLAGFFIYGVNKVNVNQLARVLAVESAVRGKHATGLAYIHNGELNIQKAAKPADKFDVFLPRRVKAVMIHTRHTTQGSEKFNFNNHPFQGHANGMNFALAHNGVLDNDRELKKEEDLPKTEIQTDSYVAVQLIEKYDDLKSMAERVSGMFTFTTLTAAGVLSIVKNDSPMHFVNIPSLQMFVYGSTADIVNKALKQCGLDVLARTEIKMKAGEIWTFQPNGTYDKINFQVNESYYNINWNARSAASGSLNRVQLQQRMDWYEEDLRWRCYDEGISDEEFDMLLDYYQPMDIEDALDSNMIDSYVLECYRYNFKAQLDGSDYKYLEHIK